MDENGPGRSSSKDEGKTDLAEDRTHWAEDRTVLANERTFGGWIRTGLASVGVGLGFQALFSKADNIYLAKGGASVFVAIGIAIFILSFLSARRVLRRLEAHAAEPIPRSNLAVICVALCLGAALLGVLLWLL